MRPFAERRCCNARAPALWLLGWSLGLALRPPAGWCARAVLIITPAPAAGVDAMTVSPEIGDKVVAWVAFRGMGRMDTERALAQFTGADLRGPAPAVERLDDSVEGASLFELRTNAFGGRQPKLPHALAVGKASWCLILPPGVVAENALLRLWVSEDRLVTAAECEAESIPGSPALAWALAEHDLVVIDLSSMPPRAADLQRVPLAHALDAAGPQAARWWLTLPPPATRFSEQRFGCLALYKAGILPGLFRSPSTRRAGVVTVDDARATLCYGLTGRRGDAGPGNLLGARLFLPDESVEQLDRQLRRQAGQAQWCLPVVRLLTIVGLLAWLGLLAGRGSSSWLLLRRLAAITPPLIFLGVSLTPLDVARDLPTLLLLGVGGGILLAGALTMPPWWRQSAHRITCALALGVVFGDTLRGGAMLCDAVLSLGVVIGGRFYGVPNVYAGLAMAAALGLACGSQNAQGKNEGSEWIGVALLALAAVVVGAPWWGANWGASTACAGACVYLLARWRHRDRGVVRPAVWGLIGAVAWGAAVMVFDAFARDGTHLGAFARQVVAMGWPAFSDAVGRKLTTHADIIARQPALLLTIFFPPLLWLWAVRRPPRETSPDCPAAGRPWVEAAAFGLLLGLALNDSGVSFLAAGGMLTLSVLWYNTLHETAS